MLGQVSVGAAHGDRVVPAEPAPNCSYSQGTAVGRRLPRSSVGSRRTGCAPAAPAPVGAFDAHV